VSIGGHILKISFTFPPDHNHLDRLVSSKQFQNVDDSNQPEAGIYMENWVTLESQAGTDPYR